MKIKPQLILPLGLILGTILLGTATIVVGNRIVTAAAKWLSLDLSAAATNLPSVSEPTALEVISKATPLINRLAAEEGREQEAGALRSAVMTLVLARQYPSAINLINTELKQSVEPLLETDRKHITEAAAQDRPWRLKSWGVDQSIIDRAGYGVSVPIYYLHHVVDDGQPCAEGSCGASIHKSKLDQLLTRLDAQGYNSIDLNQLSDALRHGQTLATKPYVITFDDGYIDLYRYGLPALANHNTKATFYVMPGMTGKDNNWYMDWPQLDDIRAHYPNISIENHTMEHKPLKGKTPANIFSDINDAKVMLESRYNAPFRHFCYPYGLFDQTVITQATRAGVLTATSTIEGTFQTPDNLYSLRRTRVSDYTNIEKLLP